ncbi:MAG: hypothetical protein OXQ29_18455 [Rhodospirillaceae bacterium]|nr:hypothetical protein [Rhodospirillaceae bacterium]
MSTTSRVASDASTTICHCGAISPVVEQPHLDLVEEILRAARQLHVARARLGRARRVAAVADQGARVALERLLQVRGCTVVQSTDP